MIDLAKTVFILDGPSDIKSFTAKLQKEFDQTPDFRKAPSNGHTVSPEGYANGVWGIVNFALNSTYLHIFCILDREKRDLSAESLAKKVKDKLISLVEESGTISVDEFSKKIRVVVADRMFENWIVADIQGIREKGTYIKQDAEQGHFDGQSGVNVLKNIMQTNYDKVQHAPILFKAVCFDRAVQNSPSFSNLIRAME